MRNVRNFWLSANVDGRSTVMEGGPQAKDGGMRVRILQRDGGRVGDGAVDIMCRPIASGRLRTTVEFPAGAKVETDAAGRTFVTFETER
jgi:hypothetical protein